MIKLREEEEEMINELLDALEDEERELEGKIDSIKKEMNFYIQILNYPFLKFLLNRKSWRGVHFGIYSINKSNLEVYLNTIPQEYEYNAGLSHRWEKEDFHFILPNDEVIENAVKCTSVSDVAHINNIRKGETIGMALERLGLDISQLSYVVKEKYKYNDDIDFLYKEITLYKVDINTKEE